MDCPPCPAEGTELLTEVVGLSWGSASPWTWATACSKMKNLLWLWPGSCFYGRTGLHVSSVLICILKRAANYIATAWARRQLHVCRICCLRFSRLWQAWDGQKLPAIQEQHEPSCPWRGNGLPSPQQPSALISSPGRGVLLSPCIPAGKCCKACSPGLLVYAFGAALLPLIHPKPNTCIAKHQGASVTFWSQTACSNSSLCPALCQHLHDEICWMCASQHLWAELSERTAETWGLGWQQAVEKQFSGAHWHECRQNHLHTCACLSHTFLKRGGMYFWNTCAKNKPILAVYEERQV